MTEETTLDRRRFLTYAGSTGAVVLAGCGESESDAADGATDDTEDDSGGSDDDAEEMDSGDESAEPEPFELRLLYDGHFHGRLGDAGGERNVANYFGLARRLAAEAPGHSMTVGGGDELHMSVMSSVFDGTHMVDALNASPVEYVPVGNHEFDTGPEVYREAVADSEFGWLSANVLDSDTGEAFAAEEGARRYVVEEVDGVRIGITGLTPENTPEIASVGENTEFLDPFEAAEQVTADLEAEGVDLVVLLNHIASPTTEELVAAVDGIDVAVGDHASFVYDEVLEVNDTLLSFVGDELDRLGQLDLTVVDGEITEYEFASHDIVSLAEAGEIDSHGGVADVHERYNADLDEEVNEVIGETTAAIDVRRETVRQRESGFGSYIADVMRANTDADVVIQNGGGIRTDRVYDPGEITRRLVIDVLPYPNESAAVALTGSEVVEALEHGVANVSELDGRFPQVSGMRYAYDPAATVGDRVSDVTVGGEPIDEDATYTVGTNDFLLGGGDGYEILADAEVVRPAEEGRLLSAAVALAIEDDEVISPEPQGRIEVLEEDSGGY